MYSYDNANRVTTQVNADGTYTYTYDNANELTNVDKNGTQVESYSYDLNGNRTATGYTTTVMNETATSPGVTYTYDNAGNMISANNGTTITTYTYDFHNRLTEVTQGGTVIATYMYDALNRRIGVDDNGTADLDGLRWNESVRRFQRIRDTSRAVSIRPRGRGWGGCGSVARADQLGRNNGLVPAGQARFGARHREHIGDRARPHRL